MGINEPVHDLREIVNAILYLDRTGMAWAYLPHDFPPASTVYGYYAAWQRDGTTERLHEMLRRRVRTNAGRSPEPTAALADAQSVKTSGNVPESSQGVDAAAEAVRGGTHVRLADAASATCPRLRDTPGSVVFNDPLGDDRRYVPTRNGRGHPNVANRPIIYPG